VETKPLPTVTLLCNSQQLTQATLLSDSPKVA